MINDLENDPEYLRTLLRITRERLANALFTVTELEAVVAIAQKPANLDEASNKKED